MTTYHVTNVPRKDDPNGFECDPMEDGGFHLRTTDGTTIVHIESATAKGMASQIAHMATCIRDAGFEQGRAHVRKALGVKDA